MGDDHMRSHVNRLTDRRTGCDGLPRDPGREVGGGAGP